MKRYLLDTNAVSEWTKPTPDAGLLKWFAQCDEDLIYISVITLAELRRGVARMESGRRRLTLDAWLGAELPQRFQGRILGINESVADAWGEIVAARELMGRPIAAMDAFIAATVIVNDMTLVTRNVTDFESSLAQIISPWLK